MNVLLTSCGLETKVIEDIFMSMLPKQTADIRALFIPTAANNPDAIDVLPACLEDLLKCGIKRENIYVYDLYDELTNIHENFDVIYICGGTTEYLLRRINERGFDKELHTFIANNGVVLGVSAGSVIFANNLPDNLGFLHCSLMVHSDDNECEAPGHYKKDREEEIKLGNRQAIIFEGEKLLVIE